MGEFELIFFAAIAAFFAYKLWAVLGRTNGDEKSRAAEIVTITEKQPVITKKPTLLKQAEVKPVEVVEEIIPEQFKADIDAIKKIDASFTLASFLQGAELAFEGVINAYSAGNRKRLGFLLNSEVFANFEADLAKYEDKNLKTHISLVSVDAAEIVNIDLKDKTTAQITVKFSSEQINFVTDKADKVVEGSKTNIERIKDVWVFERDLTSRKPQWLIVGTDGE